MSVPSEVEFVSLTGYNPGSELNGAAGGGGFDLAFYRRFVAALEEAGFDYTLNGDLHRVPGR